MDNELPTKPGYYWYKGSGFKWEPVEVVVVSPEIRIYHRIPYFYTSPDAKGKWGPEIIPPEE